MYYVFVEPFICNFDFTQICFKPGNFSEFFQKCTVKMIGAGSGAGAEIFNKLEPEPHKHGPAPQYCYY
jgi:hypothetical protein